MAKCVHCNGCFKTIWVNNRVYRYCALCRLVYKLEGGDLVLETDKSIINYIFSTREGIVI